jgi:hypothetical protein
MHLTCGLVPPVIPTNSSTNTATATSTQETAADRVQSVALSNCGKFALAVQAFSPNQLQFLVRFICSDLSGSTWQTLELVSDSDNASEVQTGSSFDLLAIPQTEFSFPSNSANSERSKFNSDQTASDPTSCSESSKINDQIANGANSDPISNGSSKGAELPDPSDRPNSTEITACGNGQKWDKLHLIHRRSLEWLLVASDLSTGEQSTSTVHLFRIRLVADHQFTDDICSDAASVNVVDADKISNPPSAEDANSPLEVPTTVHVTKLWQRKLCLPPSSVQVSPSGRLLSTVGHVRSLHTYFAFKCSHL